MPRGAEAYASILATLAAGGYFCPVNIELPARRIQDIQLQFDPHIVIAETEWFNEHFSQEAAGLLCDPALVAPLEFDLSKARRNHLAYVIFTSGSTGRPKGVVIPRSAASHFVQQFSKLVGVGPHDRWAQFSNLGFDLSLVDVFVALTRGAALVPIARPHQRMFPALCIKDEFITIWHSVPSVVDLMAKSSQITPDNLRSLRIASFCGEPLRHQHLVTLFSAKPSLEVFNTYGPTETTMFCTAQRLTSGDYEQFCSSSASVGETLPGWQIELTGGATPDDGEIVIFGDNIGLGYFNDPSLTDAAYRTIPAAMDSSPSRRAYYTGDWAERVEGKLYFRNRIDRQVKISGNRLELGEVEHHLRNVARRHCCVVLAQEGLLGVIETDDDVDEVAILTDLRALLPSFAIPKGLVTLPKLPRNINDKTDTALVKEMAVERWRQGRSNNGS